ncbi:MAG: M3 family metallopeptidase [Bacteroidales bacterium]|jgi:peptidyl-dipeptidase Dcp|nr:M3 family metallopeptidase [Bacteroidales bacterium]
MKKLALLIVMASVIISSCSKKETSDNPLLNEFNTPFGVPPFEQIKPEHFKPAYLKGFEEQNVIIRKIITSKEEPTFENTIKELEYSSELLTKVSRIFGALNSAHTNDSLQAINMEMAPLLSKHRDDINLNDTLFLRIKSVYDNMDKFNLTEEEKKIVDDTYKGFVRSGAELSPGDKDKLRKINGEMSTLSVRFGQNLLAETNNFTLFIDRKEDLAGLPEGVIAQAASTAERMDQKGKWAFTIQYPIMEPFLKYAENRELRKQLFTAYFMKGDNGNEYDNNQITARIARLRLERAQLLGYETYAGFALERNMAKTPERVLDFLGQVWNAALPVAKAEAAARQEIINKEGGKFKLEPWDWWYYTEKIKKEKYALDDELTRPYFRIENVIDGMFHVANRLYNLNFTQRTDIPKYHPDVVTYEVTRDNEHIGVLMIDNYPRSSKRGGAWCGAYRGQNRDRDGNMIHPVVTMVTNSTPPGDGKPSLLTPYEASTLFHEFGHALHQLLSNSTYPGVSGTSVARDFVELPSQIMEHWVLEPEVLKVYALHYQTGEVIPSELIEKLENAGKFNMGFETVEFLAAALLDMEFHIMSEPAEVNVREFEKKVLDKYGLIPEIKPRYRSTYFNHIWNSGYAAGYYSYYWSEMLDADAFQAFRETGDIFSREVASRFENEILSKGGSRDPLEMYIAFRGKEPGIEALLENRGLK